MLAAVPRQLCAMLMLGYYSCCFGLLGAIKSQLVSTGQISCWFLLHWFWSLLAQFLTK